MTSKCQSNRIHVLYSYHLKDQMSTVELCLGATVILMLCVFLLEKIPNDPLTLPLHHILQREVNTNIATGKEDNS